MSNLKTNKIESFVACFNNDIPKYVVKIQLLKCIESETEVKVVSRVKSQYVIYKEDDNVLYKINQLLWQIGAELSHRNEEACEIDITRYVLRLST